MKQQKANFTAQELIDIKSQMEENGVAPEIIELAMKELSPNLNTKAKSPVGDKGIKIALKRKGNKLGVGFVIDIKAGKTITLSSFTGNSLDYAVLSEVATKNGYSLTAL